MHITLVLTVKPEGSVANHRTAMNAQGCALIVGGLLEASCKFPIGWALFTLPPMYVDPQSKIGRRLFIGPMEARVSIEPIIFVMH